MFRRPLFFALALCLLVALLVAAFWNYTQDDVFITYAYSRNLAQGNGFVFNPGERVQGSTTPLWALLMAGVYWLTPDLLHAGNLLGGVLVLAACGLTLLLLRESVQAGVASAVLLATSPLLYASLGMETPLYVALLLGAFLLWARGRRAWALALAALLTWTRADGVVLGGVLCLLALLDSEGGVPFRRTFRRAVLLGLLYTALIAPWFLFAWAYFGTPLPNTFSAKQELARGIAFLFPAGVERWQTFYGGNPLSLLALLCIPVGAWRAWATPALRPLTLWAALYTLGYTLLNVTNFWYYTPLVAVLTLLTALGAERLVRALLFAAGLRREKTLEHLGARRDLPPPPRALGVARAACLALLLLAGALNVWRVFDLSAPPPRMATYRLAGEWIAAHTPPDASLLLADLGVAGYYAQRRTLDSFGLIVPHLLVKTPEYATLKFLPDYLLATQYYFWDFTRERWFADLYRPVAQFSTPGDTQFAPMTLYARRYTLNAVPTALMPGGTVAVPCDVYPAAGTALDWTNRIALFPAGGGDPLAQAFYAPFAGQYPLPAAPEGEFFIEQLLLRVPFLDGAANALLRWQCGGMEHTQPLHFSPSVSAPGDLTAADVPAVWNAPGGGLARLVSVLPSPQVMAYADDLNYGNNRHLVLWSGGELPLTFGWETLGAGAADYSVFVHLVDAQGSVVAQGDAAPGVPTSGWTAGGVLYTRHSVRLPGDLPAGDYTLRIGWYDPATLTRLPLADGGDFAALPYAVRVAFPGGSGNP